MRELDHIKLSLKEEKGIIAVILLLLTFSVGSAVLFPGSPLEPELKNVEAVSGEDQTAVYYLETPNRETQFEFYDTISGTRVKKGWAVYDPASDTWVIAVGDERIGIKQ